MPNSKKVLEVQNVETTIYKTFPPTLGVFAEGVVPTLGYTNGQLIPYVYVHFPQDGIWDFVFVADAPNGPAPEVISPITAAYFWHDYPKDLKGVRIHAAINSMEKSIGSAKERSLELMAKK